MMAKVLFDAVFLIASMLNVVFEGVSTSRSRDIHLSPIFSDNPNTVFHARADAHLGHARAKRCTCYSFKDRECVYYCHLGIIWINTPQRTVPYGMSSYRSPQRLRRSSDSTRNQFHRCTCSNRTDTRCHIYCHTRRLATR